MKKSKDPYSLKLASNRKVFKEGMKDGFPIGLGYFAVAFSLGIMVKEAGLTPFQGMMMSFTTNASAGEYAALTVISTGGTYLSMMIMTLVASGRYLLMSFAMSQRLDPNLKWYHRIFMPYDLSDELFAIAIARPGYLNPNYTYGAVLTAFPGWSIGTFIGTYTGSILPDRIVSALSVALFGMFLAVIVPAAKSNRVVAGAIIVSFALSYACTELPVISTISEGNRTIILTIVISAAVAILFPRKSEEADVEPATEHEHRTHWEVEVE